MSAAPGHTRLLRLAVILALLCTGSGLPSLCAQCVESPAPDPCHADMLRSSMQIDAMQAVCCCLLDASGSEQAPVISGPESTKVATARLARGSALTWRVSQYVVLVPHDSALQAQVSLFRLYCSFLI